MHMDSKDAQLVPDKESIRRAESETYTVTLLTSLADNVPFAFYMKEGTVGLSSIELGTWLMEITLFVESTVPLTLYKSCFLLVFT